MTGRAAAARTLDWIAIVLVAGILTALAVPWVRPEDLLIALVLVGGLRFLLRPLPIPAFHAPTVVGVATAAYARKSDPKSHFISWIGPTRSSATCSTTSATHRGTTPMAECTA